MLVELKQYVAAVEVLRGDMDVREEGKRLKFLY